MCYIVWHSVSLFSPAAAFKARESKAMQEILLREFWFSPLPDLILLSKRTQKNLMKWEYLGITGSKLTLYYRWSLEERKRMSKGRWAHDPACPCVKCKLHRDLWGEKVVRGWKGSKWLERSRVTPSKEAVNAFPAPCFPNTTRESPPLSAGPCLPARWPFPYQFANTAPHQDIPLSPQLGCTHRNMAAQYSANCSLSSNF